MFFSISLSSISAIRASAFFFVACTALRKNGCFIIADEPDSQARAISWLGCPFGYFFVLTSLQPSNPSFTLYTPSLSFDRGVTPKDDIKPSFARSVIYVGRCSRYLIIAISSVAVLSPSSCALTSSATIFAPSYIALPAMSSMLSPSFESLSSYSLSLPNLILASVEHLPDPLGVDISGLVLVLR